MTTTTNDLNIMNTRQLRELVHDIASDYDKQSSLPMDRDAARLIMHAPELLDMVRQLSVAVPIAARNLVLLDRAKELLARVDASA